MAEHATTTLVRGLGATSAGLGVTEMVAPAKVAAVAGIDDTDRTRRVLRLLGARECAHALACLFGREEMVWTRVGGDVLDVTLLAVGLAKSTHPRRRRRGTATALGLALIGAADCYAGLRATRDRTTTVYSH